MLPSLFRSDCTVVKIRISARQIFIKPYVFQRPNKSKNQKKNFGTNLVLTAANTKSIVTEKTS